MNDTIDFTPSPQTYIRMLQIIMEKGNVKDARWAEQEYKRVRMLMAESKDGCKVVHPGRLQHQCIRNEGHSGRHSFEVGWMHDE